MPAGGAQPPAERILAAARTLLFARGYNALTMDELAHELGMSKKTLYTHFDSKDALIGAVIDFAGAAIRREVGLVLENPALAFTDKLHGILTLLATHWSRVTPALLREMQRFAPAIYRRFAELREKNIPVVIGRVLREGIAAGMVRDDIEVAFAVEFWIQSFNGLVQPETLDRLGLTPQAAFAKGVHLFFWAVLTERGRTQWASLTPAGVSGEASRRG